VDEESQPPLGSIANARANNNICIVSPSLLSADWGDMKAEVQRCVDAGATRLHVDIFDGVFIDSPHALTFGPKMVQAIRNSCSTTSTSDQCETPAPVVYLDLHVCVVSPERYVEAMAATGADCFIFQWEAMALPTAAADPVNDNDRLQASTQLAKRIVDAGMDCGISINPKTNVQDILPLIETGLVSVVDILAVEPGFGGQDFQPVALEKARFLNTWLNEHGRDSDDARQIDIMVDGGVNGETASEIRSAGANILVSGSFLFGHPAGMQRGIEALLSLPSK
jgi:ribulose-phosphate 3-epimerase